MRVTPTRLEIVRPQSLPPLSIGTRDCARLVGISERRLLQLVAAGRIPHVRIDRRIVFRLASVDAWLAAQERGGVAFLSRVSSAGGGAG